MNKFTLSGYLIKNPEKKCSSSSADQIYTNFTLAAEDRFKRKDNGERETDLFNCVAFGKTAEFVANYAVKGTRLLVIGRVKPESYKTKDGITHYGVKVLCEEVELAGGKKYNEEEQLSDASTGTGMNMPFTG